MKVHKDLIKTRIDNIDFGKLFMADSGNGVNFANFEISDPSGRPLGNFVEYNKIWGQGIFSEHVNEILEKNGIKSKSGQILLNRNANIDDIDFIFSDIVEKFGSLKAAGKFEIFDDSGNLIAVATPKPLIDDHVPLEKISEMSSWLAKSRFMKLQAKLRNKDAINDATRMAIDFIFGKESRQPDNMFLTEILMESTGVDCSSADVIRNYTKQVVTLYFADEINSGNMDYLKEHFNEIDFGKIFLKDSNNGNSFVNFRVTDPFGNPIGNFIRSFELSRPLPSGRG